MTHTGIHETSYTTDDGEIEVRIEFEVCSFGCAARVNFDEHDHPAEPPEVDVLNVDMLNAPYSGRKGVYIPAWDWLYEWAGDWCDEHASELAGIVSLDIDAKRDDAADARYNAMREREA